MSTDRKIAWFGIGLSVLGLIPIFRDANVQIIVAYCLLFFALVGFFLYAAYRTSGPQYTTLSLKKELEIEDREGHLSHLKRIQRIRVNYGSVEEIWCRGIYADGKIDNFSVDGAAPPTHDRIESGHTVSLRKRFPEAIFSGHEATVEWSYDLHDSFPNSHEALESDIRHGTRKVELTVLLPTDRLCIKASMHLLAGGDPVSQLDDPEISEDRRSLRSIVWSPKSGHTLRLSWDW